MGFRTSIRSEVSIRSLRELLNPQGGLEGLEAGGRLFELVGDPEVVILAESLPSRVGDTGGRDDAETNEDVPPRPTLRCRLDDADLGSDLATDLGGLVARLGKLAVDFLDLGVFGYLDHGEGGCDGGRNRREDVVSHLVAG